MKNLKNKKAFSLIELSIVILIIGIIVAGVTQSSRLIGAFKLNTARNVTQSSPVHSIKDLALWLEPVMENSITSATNGTAPENADRISSWNDINSQSTIKINLTQGTNGSRPYYLVAGINNLPTLQFSGAQYLDNTSLVPIPAGHKEYTIVLVWRSTNISGNQVMVNQRGALSCTTGDHAGIFISSSTNRSWGCNSDTAIAAVSADTNYLTINRIDNNQANNVTNYLNGTKYGPSASPSALTIAATAFAVGFGDTSSGFYYTGYISEVIVFTRALKADEIADIRTYISKKYGFSA